MANRVASRQWSSNSLDDGAKRLIAVKEEGVKSRADLEKELKVGDFFWSHLLWGAPRRLKSKPTLRGRHSLRVNFIDPPPKPPWR